MNRIFSSAVVVTGLLLAGFSQAYEVAKEFSATAVQKVPARPEFIAHMYISKEAVRTDSSLNNVPVIEIINTKKQVRWLLVPKDKIYLQQKSVTPASSTNKSKSKKPCEGLPQTTCNLLAKEKINNLQTEKWEFVINSGQQPQRSLHWIEVERRMPVREMFPDGTMTELVLLGKEKMNNRNAEKWGMTVTHANGQQVHSKQWYDPELKMTIREEMQGGFVRELRDIKPGKQDKKLFVVPTDYKKVEQMPAYLLPPQAVTPPGVQR